MLLDNGVEFFYDNQLTNAPGETRNLLSQNGNVTPT